MRIRALVLHSEGSMMVTVKWILNLNLASVHVSLFCSVTSLIFYDMLLYISLLFRNMFVSTAAHLLVCFIYFQPNLSQDTQRMYNVTLWCVRLCNGKATVSSCIIALRIAVKYGYLKRCHEEATMSLWKSYVAVDDVNVLKSSNSAREFCPLITTFWFSRKILIKAPTIKPHNNPLV